MEVNNLLLGVVTFAWDDFVPAFLPLVLLTLGLHAPSLTCIDFFVVDFLENGWEFLFFVGVISSVFFEKSVVY